MNHWRFILQMWLKKKYICLFPSFHPRLSLSLCILAKWPLEHVTLTSIIIFPPDLFINGRFLTSGFIFRNSSKTNNYNRSLWTIKRFREAEIRLFAVFVTYGVDKTNSSHKRKLLRSGWARYLPALIKERKYFGECVNRLFTNSRAHEK